MRRFFQAARRRGMDERNAREKGQSELRRRKATRKMKTQKGGRHVAAGRRVNGRKERRGREEEAASDVIRETVMRSYDEQSRRDWPGGFPFKFLRVPPRRRRRRPRRGGRRAPALLLVCLQIFIVFSASRIFRRSVFSCSLSCRGRGRLNVKPDSLSRRPAPSSTYRTFFFF